MNVSGGIETIPQAVTWTPEPATELTVQMHHGSTWRRGAGTRAIRTSIFIRAARST